MRIRRHHLGGVIFDKTAAGEYRWASDDWSPGQAGLWMRMKRKHADLMEQTARFLGAIAPLTKEAVLKKLPDFKPGRKYIRRVESCGESVTVIFYDIT